MNSVDKVQAKISLDIAVIGGGICGLATAMACARTGMTVTVYEAVSTMTEVGAGIQVGPNMSRILGRWNLLEALLPKAFALKTISLRRYANDIELSQVSLNNVETIYGSPILVVHRADLHSVLKVAAEKAGVKIYTGHTVEDIDFENTCIKIKNDSNWIEADVIIAADGIKSIIRKKMLEFHNEVDLIRETGDAGYRAVIPAERIYASKDVGLIEIMEGSSIIRWMGPDRHIICYPFRNRELFNSFMVHPDKPGTDESWTTKCDKKEMVDFYAGWNNRVQAIMECVPDEVLEWKLCDHSPLSTWIEGKVALAGDSAHPMLPYVAQGGAQAIEDAAVISICLAMIDSKSQVNTALKVYELVRKERSEIMQASSDRSKYNLHLHDGKEQEDRDEMFRNAAKGGPNPDLWADKSFQKWAWGTEMQQKTFDMWDQLRDLVTSGQSFESPFSTQYETWTHMIRNPNQSTEAVLK